MEKSTREQCHCRGCCRCQRDPYFRTWGLRLCGDTALPTLGLDCQRLGTCRCSQDSEGGPRTLALFSAQSVCSGCAVTCSLHLLSRALRSPTAWEGVGSLLTLIESTVGEGSAPSSFLGAHCDRQGSANLFSVSPCFCVLLSTSRWQAGCVPAPARTDESGLAEDRWLV